MLLSSTLTLTWFLLLSCLYQPTQAIRHNRPQHHNHLFAAAAPAPPPPLYPGTSAPKVESDTADNDTQPARTGLICRPWGECSRCPPEALDEPFCQPFGNRQQMHCVNATEFPDLDHSSSSSHQNTSPPSSSSSSQARPLSEPPPLDHNSTTHPLNEVLAWESCGRLVPQERADFYEFVAVNFLFAIIAIFGVVVRTRRMKMIQARQLAARIGVGFGRGGGGMNR